jgi:tetratricopeptide (TPR) repeat protein
MGEDRYGLPVTSSSPSAVDLYCEALDLALAQRDGALELVAEALDLDGGFALAWGLRGLIERARGDLAGGNDSIKQALVHAGTRTERERSHLDVVERFAFSPQTVEAAIHTHLERWPRDAVVVMQAHFFYNIVDSRPDRDARLLALAEAVAPAFGDDWYMLGELAFAAEENGQYQRARDLAEEALAGNGENAMAAHPLAHVFLETGDVDRGTRWLRDWLDAWASPSAFACHLTWHLALLRLAAGDEADVRRLLDEILGFGGAATSALTDGASLSWRLGLDDSDIPLAWDRLASLPDRPGFTFGNAHHGLALAGAGDVDGLASYSETLDGLAAAGHPSAGGCAEFVRALGDLVRGASESAADRLTGVAPQFRNFGGSHAQTEVFEDTLIAALERSHRGAEAAELLRARLARRGSVRDDRWLSRLA